MTHSELIEVGRNWLSKRSPVVLTEIKSCREEPDIFGLSCNIKIVKKDKTNYNCGSVLIECKASRSDFKADAKKSFRYYPKQGIGRYRYYLAPKGLISPEELPEKWGLLETQGKRIKVIKIAAYQPDYNHENEMRIVVSAIRRLRIPAGGHCSIQAYTYETKNTASITLNPEHGENES